MINLLDVIYHIHRIGYIKQPKPNFIVNAALLGGPEPSTFSGSSQRQCLIKRDLALD